MHTVKIPKKSGGTRTIYIQDPRSCGKYRQVARELTTVCVAVAPPGVLHGFMPGKSPVTNAAAHVGAKYMLNMDLADFFDHCDKAKIAEGLLPVDVRNIPPEWLPAGKLEAAKKVAEDLAARAVYDGAARQGLSSSPMAANCAAIPMDISILAAVPHGVTYTRYADDMTFSADNFESLKFVRQIVPGIAERYGQKVKESKTRMQAASAGRIVVTGVAIDGENLMPTKSVRRRLRAAVHNCRKIINTITLLCAAGRTDHAAMLWRVNWRQFSRARGLNEWSKLK